MKKGKGNKWTKKRGGFLGFELPKLPDLGLYDYLGFQKPETPAPTPTKPANGANVTTQTKPANGANVTTQTKPANGVTLPTPATLPNQSGGSRRKRKTKKAK